MARLLGLDPGAVRCGVAITDSARTMAFPRPVLASGANLIATLRDLIVEEGVAQVVVGRPVALSGRETASTSYADALVAQLRAAVDNVTVVPWDERLTTQQAQRSLGDAGVRARHHRDHIDSAAAVIMLENYLDGHRAP